MPTLFTAATWKMYAAPLVRPVTVPLVAMPPMSTAVLQVLPPLLLYCTK